MYNRVVNRICYYSKIQLLVVVLMQKFNTNNPLYTITTLKKSCKGEKEIPLNVKIMYKNLLRSISSSKELYKNCINV